MEKILLNPKDWWIGKNNGTLMVVMFAVRSADGVLNVCWEVLDESNLPVDLVRHDGEEYTFILPVSFDRHAVVKEVGASLRSAAPQVSLDACSVTTGASMNCDSVFLVSGIGGNEMANDRPTGGVVIHGVSDLSGIQSNVSVCRRADEVFGG